MKYTYNINDNVYKVIGGNIITLKIKAIIFLEQKCYYFIPRSNDDKLAHSSYEDGVLCLNKDNEIYSEEFINENFFVSYDEAYTLALKNIEKEKNERIKDLLLSKLKYENSLPDKIKNLLNTISSSKALMRHSVGDTIEKIHSNIEECEEEIDIFLEEQIKLI